MQSNYISLPTLPLMQVSILALGPGFLMLFAPYGLGALFDWGRTVILSSYYLAEAGLLFAIMYFFAQRHSISLKEVVRYNRPVPKSFFLMLAGLGALSAVFFRDIFTAQALTDFSMRGMQLMKGWPSVYGMLPAHDGPFVEGVRFLEISAVLVETLAVSVASLMQTLYFRGFLLSRIDGLGVRAPIIITVLFVMFHMGSPWFWPQFLLLSMPWAFIAYFTKNVWIVVVSHIVMNSYSGLWYIGVRALE